MVIDGRTLAQGLIDEAKETVARASRAPKLVVFVIGSNPVTEQFIRIKKRVADQIGVSLFEEHLPESTTTEELERHIGKAILETDGVVVQLPLPSHIDFEKIRDALPASYDVDCLGREAEGRIGAGAHEILPPVVAAFKKILETEHVDPKGKRVVVVGHGRLVGAPAARWFLGQDADVSVCDEHTEDISKHTQNADIIVLGAGVPNLLKPDMIREGVVILDAGTSESGGKVVGDADFACAEKASLMTPVPGGVGPVAVAMLFCNLMTLFTHAL